MTRLSVNVNKIATLRNARGGNVPDLLEFAKKCEEFGADGITIHPRPDERHIRYKDVYDLKEIVTTELNIEGYPDKRFLALIAQIKPEQVTLVPDAPNVLTSDSGWDTAKNKSFLTEVVQEIKSHGCRLSLFMNTDLEHIAYCPEIGADRIELYTGPYASAYDQNKNEAIKDFVSSAKHAKMLNIDVNAGHDLNLKNLKFFRENISFLKEVSIGHALISDALYLGIEQTIKQYKSLIQ